MATITVSGILKYLGYYRRYILFTVQWPYFFSNSKQRGSHWYSLFMEPGQQEHVLSPNQFPTHSQFLCLQNKWSLHCTLKSKPWLLSSPRNKLGPGINQQLPFSVAQARCHTWQPALLWPLHLTYHPDLSDCLMSPEKQAVGLLATHSLCKKSIWTLQQAPCLHDTAEVLLISLSNLKNIPVFSKCPVSHGQSQFKCPYRCRNFLVSSVQCHSPLFSKLLSLEVPIDIPSLPDHCLSLHYTAGFWRQKPGLYSVSVNPQYLMYSLETAPVAVEWASWLYVT